MMDASLTSPLQIYFVNQKTASTCSALLKAFSHTIQTGSDLLKPHWIHEEDLRNEITTATGGSKSTLFVCETFSGPAFKDLRQSKLRIWGADCLLGEPEVLVERWLSTRVPTLPLLNTFMSGMVVCCSGIPQSVKVKMHERVLLMGGNYSTVLRSTVTHLVADRVATPKYFAAAKNGIDVMNAEFIEELWEQSLLGHTTIERDQIIDLLTAQHMLLPLRGLKIYLDPSLTAKSVYNRLVQNCGGTSCSDPTGADVTHFVTEKMSTISVVSARAARVTSQWLIDSSKNKRCEEWKKYEVPKIKSPSKPSSSRINAIRAKRTSLPGFSDMSQCSTSTPKKPRFTVQNEDMLDIISPIKELRRSPRKLKPFSTPEKSGTVPSPKSGGFVFSPKTASRSKRSGSPGPSRSKKSTTSVSSVPVDHDENARDGLMDLSPTRAYSTTTESPVMVSSNSPNTKPTLSSPFVRMLSMDSTCDVLLGSSQPNSEPSSSASSQPGTLVPTSPIKSSKNLARRVLHLGSVTKSATRPSNPTKSPSKLSSEDFLRPSKASFGGSYHRLSLDANSSSQLSWDHEINSDKRGALSSSTVSDSRVVPKTRVFMISRMKEDFDKDALMRLQSAITTLGADYLASARFDPACTHVICAKPYHTEKFLACCASGRKVLHVNYIYDSLEAGRFLEEDAYEWGNKSAGAFSKDLTDSELRWATTARWWRSFVTSPELKAFHGWKVVVAPNIPRRESYEAVIQAGGGIVLDAKPDSTQHATHLFHACAVEDYDQLQTLRDSLQLKADLKLITGHELELCLQEKVHGELPRRLGSLVHFSTQVPRGSQTTEKIRKSAFSTLTLTTVKPVKRKT